MRVQYCSRAAVPHRVGARRRGARSAREVHMRIRFERAGGLAPPAMKRSGSVESDGLPPDQAQELRKLLESANLSSLPGPSTAGRGPARPDMFHYRLVVEDGGQEHTVVFSDADMPPPVRRLMEWLLQRGAPGS